MHETSCYHWQRNRLTGHRGTPNGTEDTPMFKVNVNAAKAEAMGVALSDINQTISTAFGSSYVNDFLNRGRVKKCMSGRHAVPYVAG